MLSPPPGAGHSPDFEELAGLAALRVLEGDELSSFEQHAAGCARCRSILDRDRQTLARLSLAAPEMDPSPGLKERLLQRAAAELAAQAPGQPVPIRPRPPANVVSFWRRQRAWLASVAAVLVVALGGLGVYQYENQVVASVVLSGSLPGSATVIVRRSGAAAIEMSGLPNPPPGMVYTAWIIPPGQQPAAAGTSPTGQGELSLNGSVRDTTVALTVEQPGATRPSTPPLLAATVQA